MKIYLDTIRAFGADLQLAAIPIVDPAPGRQVDALAPAAPAFELRAERLEDGRLVCPRPDPRRRERLATLLLGGVPSPLFAFSALTVRTVTPR